MMPKRNKDSTWQAVFGSTYESLALFRICLGSLLTLELLLRFRFLLPFYSNEGTLPLDLLLPKVDDLYKTVCIHCHFGHVWQQQILLSIQVVMAILFTVGKFTRLAAILSWFLYLSLTLRNTWLNYILDRYFHYLLFLSMFLPLDRKWSLAARSEAQPKTSFVLSPATVACKLLVVWIYLDAGWGKYSDPLGGWTYHADPLPALDTYSRHTLVARYMYAILGPSGLRLLTPVVVWVELLAAPVALLASYWKNKGLLWMAIILIWLLHIGIALTLRNAALLSFCACVAWWPFAPIGWNSSMQNTNVPAISTSLSSSSRRSQIFSHVASFLMISAMTGGNVWLARYSEMCDQSVKHIWSTLLHNRWNVFVGAEEDVTWEIAPGLLADGQTVVDVWGRRDTVDWTLPGTGAPCTATARPGRWRSFPYLAELEGDDADALWSYLCREWDRENRADLYPNRKLVTFNFFMLQADVLPNMTFSATRKRLVQTYDCVPTTALPDGQSIKKDQNDPQSGQGRSSNFEEKNEARSDGTRMDREHGDSAAANSPVQGLEPDW